MVSGTTLDGRTITGWYINHQDTMIPFGDLGSEHIHVFIAHTSHTDWNMPSSLDVEEVVPESIQVIR